jgi:DNA-binding NtrC family response regulator
MLPVIIMTAHSDLDAAVSAYQLRISDNKTSGVLVERASSTSFALSKVAQLKPAPVSGI